MKLADARALAEQILEGSSRDITNPTSLISLAAQVIALDARVKELQAGTIDAFEQEARL